MKLQGNLQNKTDWFVSSKTRSNLDFCHLSLQFPWIFSYYFYLHIMCQKLILPMSSLVLLCLLLNFLPFLWFNVSLDFFPPAPLFKDIFLIFSVFLMVHLSTGKTIALTRHTFVVRLMFLYFNTNFCLKAPRALKCV